MIVPPCLWEPKPPLEESVVINAVQFSLAMLSKQVANVIGCESSRIHLGFHKQLLPTASRTQTQTVEVCQKLEEFVFKLFITLCKPSSTHASEFKLEITRTKRKVRAIITIFLLHTFMEHMKTIFKFITNCVTKNLY